jgi:uncharacterized protein YcbX
LITAEVTHLNVYPVKSMRGISLVRAELTRKGLANDRRWMVVRASGRFVTQRELPRLALVQTALDDAGLTLSMNGHGAIGVALDPGDGERIHTRVWRDGCEAVDMGPAVSEWLGSALRTTEPLKLVTMAPGFERPQSRARDLGAETSTLFADSAPFLVANESSLAALNRELEARGHAPVPMDRFRPNIVIRGPAPFSEHSLSGLNGRSYRLRFCHPCERCVVTTIDQRTAVPDAAGQPFRTLAEINPVPGKTRSPAFAQNAVLDSGDGAVITVGDRVQAAVQVE